MMNKRILSFLLALVLVLGVLPTASATENAEPKCSTCGQTDCLGHEEEPAAQAEEAQPQTDAVYCTSCGNVLSDGVGHSEFCRLCKICGVEDCGITHEQCSICSEYDCTKTHAICVTCGNYDCAVDHTPAPSEEETSDCTCNTETETHAESCGLYVAPTQPDAEGEEEGEDKVETEQNTAPTTETVTEPVTVEDPDHIETCSDECEEEDCECECHIPTLFDRLMAAESLDELQVIFAEVTDEEYNALTDEELEQIDALIIELLPPTVPEVILEESAPPVQSEIVTVTVNFDNVAPLVGEGK